MSKRKPSGEPFVMRRLCMLRSPAFRALSHAASSVLARLEVEHMSHAGKENGRLVCTYSDFAEYGIRYPSIAPAIRQAVDLGFVKITQQGRRSPAGSHPSRYRLTYLPTATAAPTDEWRNVALAMRRPGIRSMPRLTVVS